MLTTAQVQLVGASTPDGVICLDCAYKLVYDDIGVYIDEPGELRVWLACHMPRYGPVIAYELDSGYNDMGHGVWCADCGEEMAPPCCSECGDEMTEDNWANPSIQVDRNDCPICNNCWVDEDEEDEDEV